MYLFKIMGLLIVQTFYVAYIHQVRPHAETIFNMVEFVNEYSLIILGYAMLNYIRLSPLPPDQQFNYWVELTVVSIIGIMVIVNFGVMIRLSIGKIMASYKKNKQAKFMKEKMAQR